MEIEVRDFEDERAPGFALPFRASIQMMRGMGGAVDSSAPGVLLTGTRSSEGAPLLLGFFHA